jgi:hypothetical protein
MIVAYNTLKEIIDRQLKRNKFSCVNITGIFGSLNADKNPMNMISSGGSQEDFEELDCLSDDTDKEV